MNIDDIKWKTSKCMLHIDDSYKVSYIGDMKAVLAQVRKQVLNNQCRTLLRSDFNLCCEWGAHNILYVLKYKRDHTKDVDMECEQTTKWKILFFTFGVPYLGVMWLKKKLFG